MGTWELGAVKTNYSRCSDHRRTDLYHGRVLRQSSGKLQADEKRDRFSGLIAR
jgi:hypothetical protein